MPHLVGEDLVSSRFPAKGAHEVFPYAGVQSTVMLPALDSRHYHTGQDLGWPRTDQAFPPGTVFGRMTQRSSQHPPPAPAGQGSSLVSAAHDAGVAGTVARWH